MELKLTRPIAFFDLETTGVKVATDRIIEIFILKLLPDGTTKSKTWIINPGVPIPKDSTAFHGFTDEDVKDKPVFADVVNEIDQFLENCDLAGFNNIKFDVPLLVEEFLRVDIEFDIKNRKIIDVQNIFHKMEPRNLKAAYLFYCNKELIDAHSAEADTMATYEILKSQLDRYDGVEIEDDKGNRSCPIINDIDALHRFSCQTRNVDLAGQIILNDENKEIFNFGKHKGKCVEDLFRKEPQYYDWMMKAQFPLYTKKVITAIKLRDFNRQSVKIQ